MSPCIRPTNVLLGVFTILWVIAGCASRPTVPAPHVLAAADTAAIIRAALLSYPTNNGPITQLTDRPGCRAPTCESAAADVALRAIADERQMRLVAPDEPRESCSWSGLETAGSGLRATVLVPEVQAGVVSITVFVGCGRGPLPSRDGFSQGTTFQAEYINGEWRITRTLSQVST